MAKKKPRGKLINALPLSLKPKLREPKLLEELTFKDLETVHKAFKDFKEENRAEWEKKACTACTPKLGH